MKEDKYSQAAINLCKAIAIEAIGKYPNKNWLDVFGINRGIEFYLKYKKLIENAEPKFQNMSSLKYVMMPYLLTFKKVLESL